MQRAVRTASAVGMFDDDPIAPSVTVVTTAWLRSLGDDVITTLARAVLGGAAVAQDVEIRLAALREELVVTGATTSGVYAGVAARSGVPIHTPLGASG